jgi:hypothetical protein
MGNSFIVNFSKELRLDPQQEWEMAVTFYIGTPFYIRLSTKTMEGLRIYLSETISYE